METRKENAGTVSGFGPGNLKFACGSTRRTSAILPFQFWMMLSTERAACWPAFFSMDSSFPDISLPEVISTILEIVA